jgi:hypothetical protein
MIIFSSVRFLSKKSNQTKFFFKKTETGSNRFGLVFSIWLGFSVWLGFFPVWFEFFSGFFQFKFGLI